MYSDNQHISVNVAGSTETEFTHVTYKASVTTRDKTGPDAKNQALPTIEKIKRAILLHAERGGVDTKRLKTSFDVDLHTDRHSGEFAGYKARYTISFTGKNVAHATTVHDALTSISGVESPSPVFNIDDSSEVHARAFADAVKKADVKFTNQCKALGLEPRSFTLNSWSIQEEMPRGKMLSLYNGDDSDNLSPSIEPGKANYDLRVGFVYSANSLARRSA